VAEQTKVADGDDPAAAPVASVMRAALTSVERSAHVAAASYLMRHSNQSAIVVVDDLTSMRPIAVITERDVVQAVADGVDTNDVLVSDLTVQSPLSVDSTVTIRAAADLMLEHDIQQLPVVHDGSVVGIVDFEDVCRALLRPASS
jgi:CBS domain-containing protein